MIQMTGPTLAHAQFSGGEPLHRNLTWKLTAAGVRVQLARPSPDAFEIHPQAHSLAQTNRFTGHASRPYSVAEHSLLVVDILERLGAPPIVCLAGLHHDGHESITGDVATPDKLVIGPGWQQYEQPWAQACRERWGLTEVFDHHRRLIRRADLMALATERRDLMPDHPDEWEVLRGIDPVDWLRLDTPARERLSWTHWRDRFIDEHHVLVAASAP
jgi:5'-deoxynucleotidase YfbR-like HD superfamily hydrolase